MRTETITVYTFDELPTERAKERARDWWRECWEDSWSAESRDSIKTFCEHFGAKLTSWSVGPHSPFDFSTTAEQHNFRGVKLRDFKRDHMPTGYCLDCSLWMTFFDVFKGTGDAKAAFDAAVRAGFADWRDDMEHQLSDDCIDEMLSINGYEFTEDGSRHV